MCSMFHDASTLLYTITFISTYSFSLFLLLHY